MTEDYEDGRPSSWLVLVQIWPIPEDTETVAVIDRITEVVDAELSTSYKVDVSAVYASRVEVIGMDDLDALDTIEDF